MPLVKRLSEKVIHSIAAGEVIERPASVVKELTENSIDAKATQLSIEILKAGTSLIKISDNGIGMTPEEAKLAVERHTTSKIISEKDLENINTFGFRGEALPSIMAVSKFTLTTRPKSEPSAWQMKSEGGKLLSECPAGANAGTSIEVKDIFFNTPARAKFLKSEYTERSHILRIIEDLALTSLNVAFHVKAEGKKAISANANKNLKQDEALHKRLSDCWGNQTTEKLVKVSSSGKFIKIWGWISGIDAHNSNSRNQRFFVNRRPIINRRFTHSLYEAYKGVLPTGRHPAAVLFIEIDPKYIDVNVHPTKREVRISHENEVTGFLYHAVKDSIYSKSRRSPVKLNISTSQAYYGNNQREVNTEHGISAQNHIRQETPEIPFQTSYSVSAASAPLKLNESSETAFKKRDAIPIGQVDNTYIIAQSADELLIIDQHAAHERILYEELKNHKTAQRGEKEQLLIPQNWELSSQHAEILQENISKFLKIGFEIEHFGGNTYRVKSIPASIPESKNILDMLSSILDDIMSGKVSLKSEEALLKQIACKAAIKANKVLKIKEMESLISQLKNCTMPYTCPHGRPTILKITSKELARRFRRT